MQFVDQAFIGITLIGLLYGALKGPFSTGLPLIGIYFCIPLILSFKTTFFSMFPSLEREMVYHLIYYPLAYLVCTSLLSYTAFLIDRKIGKTFPASLRFAGAGLGAAMGFSVCLAILLAVYPFLLHFSPDRIHGSKSLEKIHSYFQANPERYQTLKGWIRFDAFEAMVQKGKEFGGEGGSALPMELMNQLQNGDPEALKKLQSLPGMPSLTGFSGNPQELQEMLKQYQGNLPQGFDGGLQQYTPQLQKGR